MKQSPTAEERIEQLETALDELSRKPTGPYHPDMMWITSVSLAKEGQTTSSIYKPCPPNVIAAIRGILGVE